MRKSSTSPRDRVFVAYGRNELARVALFEFLRALGLDPVEWSAAVVRGGPNPRVERTVRREIAGARAIVVLFTGDDMARLRSEFVGAGESDSESLPRPQPRANVIYEAGLAEGIAPRRTIIVQVGRPKPFSDFAGRYVVRMDDKIASRQQLKHQLQATGCRIRATGTDWHTAGNFDLASTGGVSGDAAMEHYNVYLSCFERLPLAGTDVKGGLARARVDRLMVPLHECLITSVDADAKRVVLAIKGRMEPRLDLKEKRLPFALVTSSNVDRRLVGILTPSDTVVPKKRTALDRIGLVRVAEVMTPKPFAVRGTDTLRKAMGIMDKYDIRSGLPVIGADSRVRGFLPALGTREAIGG